MIFGTSIVLALLAEALTASVPHVARSGYALKEEVALPIGWAKHHERLPKSQLMDMRIGLVQQNVKEAEELLLRISDPRHRDYGKHMSAHEVKKLLAPSKKTIDTVMRWLQSHDIPSHHIEHVGDFVHCRVPVSKAETMLDTEYNMYHSKDTKLVRALKYSLPVDLHEHIDLIQPTTMFGSMHALGSNLVRIDDGVYSPVSGLPIYNRLDASYNVTIASLREIYNIGNYSVQNSSTSIAITSYLEESANFQDFLNFTNTFVPNIQANTTFNVTSIAGGENLQAVANATGEATLDVQYAFGMAAGVSQRTLFTTAGRPPFIDDLLLNGTNSNEPYLDFLNYVLASNYTSSGALPQVISTSYGDDEQTVPRSYAERVCRGFMTLGLLGTSVIFSSGDSGVGPGGTVTDAQCKGNIPGTANYNKTVFMPAFPASCPYVTVVGGTTRSSPEVAVEILDRKNTTAAGFFSGGGFSNYFARPSYQKSQVEAYLPTINSTYLSRGLYNPLGRGYPDVSAQSWRFRIIEGAQDGLIGGTSASSPAFAGIVALLNDKRSLNGLPTLGFLNPLLYSLTNNTLPANPLLDSTDPSSNTTTGNGTGLNDITIGSNPGCGTNGFNTAPGWDAVTGLGTPNFGLLVAQLTANTTAAGYINA